MQQRDDEAKIPSLPPNATPEQIEFQKKLEQQQRDLDAKQGKTVTSDRKAARETVNRQVDSEWSQGINTFIETRVNDMRERGEYLPDFVLTDKWINPQTQQSTKVSAFGMKLYQQLNGKIYGNPVHRAKLASLQALGKEGKEARVAELSKLTTQYLPKLFDSEVKRIQDSIRGSSKPKPPGTVDPNGNNAGKPRLEPQSQGTVVPSPMGKQEIRTWAETEAKKDPNFAAMTSADREAMIISLSAKKRFA